MAFPYTSAQLHKLLTLTSKKEALESDLKDVTAQISALVDGKVIPAAAKKVKAPVRGLSVKADKPVDKTVTKPKVAKVRKGKKGGLRDAILGVLGKAGKKGAKVVEIAKSLKTTPANIHVWFSTAGKKLDQLVKIGPGHYGIKGVDV